MNSSGIELVIVPRPRDVAGVMVRRALPTIGRRMIGPFTFFDHIGPMRLPSGQGVDVPPHPHIGLATVTYLFAGELVHRDSVGSVETIRPGDVNWMLAGRGIAHSERSSAEARQAGVEVHGIQSWVALPRALEESEPRFEHHAAASIPVVRQAGAVLRVVAGTAYGERSPVGVASPTLCVEAELEPGASVEIDGDHEERALYVVAGSIVCEDRSFGEGTMLVLGASAKVTMQATTPARVMMLGGAKLDGARHIWWNFVASTNERIDRAKEDWKARRFSPIPGDDAEHVPLPVR